MPRRSRTSTDPQPAPQPQPQQPVTTPTPAPAPAQPQQPQPPEGYNLPVSPIAPGGRVANQAMKQLGYVPEWGENPRNIVEAYRVIKATPKDVALPDWIAGQRDQIEQSYNWMQFRNKGKPPEEWAFLPPDDPGRSYLAELKGPDTKPPEEVAFSTNEQVQQGNAAWTDISPDDRKKILADPSFDITKYDIGMRDQILNDPSFDWSRVPKWQKTYFSIMSNPKIMASPMALAGAHAGGIFGLPGKLVGAAAGYGLGLVGGQQYDPTAGITDQPTIVAGMMAVLNKLSEGAEQSAGFTAQYLDAAIAGAQGNEQAAKAANKMLFDEDYRRATWEAGRITYEASDFLGSRNWIPAVAMLLGDETATFAGGGEDFIIGKAEAVDRAKAQGFNPVTGNFYDVTDSMGILQEARLTIHQAIVNGEDPREVVRQILGEQSQYVGATVADFAGQMAIDPLEHLPNVTTKTTGLLAKLAGNETAARAFLETSAPFEAARRYKTLVQSGDVPANFDYSQMGSVSRWAAGLNAEGKITAGPFTDTGLLDRPTKTTGLLSKFKEDIAALTPEARAREGANMFYNNIGALLTTMSDPAEITSFFKRLSKTDMRIAADLGNKIANSPEFYTVLPALKAFDQDKLTGLLSAWDLAAPKRDALTRVADVLGDSPGSLIEDLAKRGTSEQDFQRIVSRLQQADSPEARALLDDIEAGNFTPDNLKDIVDAFSGDGALYWHPDQWKAALMDTLGSHFDEWTVDQLQLGKDSPESKAFFRTAHLLKSAQSVLLLGGSPGYALQNGLSGMVHRAATGIYGYMTPRQIDGWLERFGVTPARLEEGVGIGGVVEQATTKSGVKTEAISKAVKGNQNDALGRAQRAVSALGKAMPFNKLSSWFEQVEGKNGYMIAMRDMWSQTWRRGKGFAEMTPDLRQQVQRAGINPDQIYNLIEAGMNKAEIEKFIFSRQSGMMSRTLINDAAQKMGIPSTSAARLLEKVGVLDELDRGLANAGTPDKIRAAFTQAIAKAADYQDMATARDLKAMAEQVTNKVGTEGAPAALDVVQRVNSEYFDAWLDHYSRFGEMFDDLRNIPDEAVRNRAIDLNYRISDQEFRRINARTAANYQGIFSAWGKSRNPRAMEILAAVAQIDSSMKSAYDFMRNTRRQFFDALRDSPDSLEPGRWDADQSAIDAEFDRAFKQKAAAEKQMGDALGAIYEEMYGKAAGEASRKWYEDYTKFSADIVKRERDFRKSLLGMTRDQREAAKQRFYQTDKVAQIAELEKINNDGIARLERVIRRGGDGLSGRTTAPGTPPRSGPGGEEINQLISDAEARVREETQAKAERVKSVWDAAEEFDRVGLPYDRNVLQDRFALLGALKKEEYGGFPDLKGLDDERLTPDKVRSILDERSKVKANEEAAKLERTLSTIPAPKITDNTNILAAIKEHGGLSSDLAADLTGDTPRRTPGVFRKKGIQMDEMARLLADDGYPIDLTRPDDPGGIQQATELLNRARSGEKVYPTGHDFETQIRRQEEAYAILQAEERTVDATLWQKGIDDAASRGDLTRVYEMFDEVPEGNAPTGETWIDYASRVADETAARVEAEARDTAVADMQAKIDADAAEMEAAGDKAMTKRILEEKLKDVFGLTDEQAAAYMEISEALAGWYTRTTGESGDAFYSRYYEDVLEGGEGGELFQTAFHGTPYKFDKFTLDKMGTGEGNQTYGWGLYFAEKKAVAEYYRYGISRNKLRFGSDEQKLYSKWDKVDEKQRAIDTLKQQADGSRQYQTRLKVAEFEYQQALEAAQGFGERPPELGQVYKVDVPDDGYLLWDAPLSQQPEVVRQALETISPLFKQNIRDVSGREIYKEIARSEGGDKAASIALRNAGLGGIKYLDEGSRGSAGEGTYDFVIFDDNAIQIVETYYQTGSLAPKGAVTFGPDSIRATIRAFESRDISTLVHENAHVFRRVLSDTASRTDNTPRGAEVKADLATIEEWAGVKEGNWTRDAEEKFARGFERYLTDGQAPTPKLKKAFESFKQWMLEVYKQVTGSQIDVKITPDVKAVFDRMLGEEKVDNFADVKRKAKKLLSPERLQEIEDIRADRLSKTSVEATEDGGAIIRFYDGSSNRVSAEIIASRYDTIESMREDVVRSQNIAVDSIISLDVAEAETAQRPLRSLRPEPTADDTSTLFQDANPLGSMENASGFKADSEWQDAGWKQHVRPLLDAMQETALDKLQNETPLDGAYKDMTPEGQAMLRQYIRQVQNDMGAVKNSTIKWGESQRDFALLNYNRRYGFDRYLETVAPYEFFATRSLMTWAMRGLDKPSWYANYARLRNLQNQHERDEPERLRNKLKIPAPWLPDWMGDALYIDPLGFLFTPANYLRPIERMAQDKNQQVLEAERVLQEWAADGTADEAQIAGAAQTQSGPLWERALAEASVRRESEISNPFDFMATLLGPAWYLSTPLNMLGVEVPFISKGKQEKVTGTPLLNTTRAVETVTKGTWAEPIGQLIGLIGKPEEALRRKAGLPEFGEFGDYYVDRQISNMVAEGLITPDQAQLAMIERQGELYDQARERVKMELAMRVPLAGTLYAGTHGGAGDAAKAFLPSVFGAGLLPQGELEYRGLKGEWNAAWKLYDAGDKTAINTFFEEHPEYEAYLAKGKEPQERLRSYLIGNIWDAYMGLGATNQKAARSQMGEDFSRSFLDKETRSYDTLDVQTLTTWARLLGAMTPQTFEGTPIDQVSTQTPSLPGTTTTPPSLNLYDEQTTAITDKYFTERKERFSDYFMLQQGYYSLPPSQRAGYLMKFPRLKEYFDWQKKYYNDYPELKPIFQGKTFKTVDTTTWPPALEEYVAVYAMTGQRIPKGAMTALEQVWIREGRPMGDLKSWLNTDVVPAFLYQQGQP